MTSSTTGAGSLGCEARGLSRILVSYLSPIQRLKPDSLDILCLRRAAVYATTALYDYHLHTTRIRSAAATGSRGGSGVQAGAVAGNHVAATPRYADGSSTIDESLWEAVFPSLDSHFLRLIPTHLYEEFLDNVLCALEVACHYDATGKALMQYVVLFFPKGMRRFKAKRCYKDRVLMPTVCCLHRCTNIEELYLEKADSPAITTYLLAHILKFLTHLKVLALPKQCDDDVASVVGLNCPQLESIVLTGCTGLTNLGLSWLLCCRKLHTVIMKGYFQGVTSKGVALLLNGLRCLRHLVYDVFSDVLTYLDFNTSELPRWFQLRTVLFHSMELLGQNHLELVSKLCPYIEWLSLDSALFYNLEGMGHLASLRFLKLNYKGRPLDESVFDFFRINAANLTALHLIDVEELTLDDLAVTVGLCPALEVLVLIDCSVALEPPALGGRGLNGSSLRPLKTATVEHLQIFGGLGTDSQGQFWDFLSLFGHLRILDMDTCPLEPHHLQAFIQSSPDLQTVRCANWTNASSADLAKVVKGCKGHKCDLQTSRNNFTSNEEELGEERKRTMAAQLLSDYVGISPILSSDSW